jgi:hypothetical protein
MLLVRSFWSTLPVWLWSTEHWHGYKNIEAVHEAKGKGKLQRRVKEVSGALTTYMDTELSDALPLHNRKN